MTDVWDDIDSVVKDHDVPCPSLCVFKSVYACLSPHVLACLSVLLVVTWCLQACVSILCVTGLCMRAGALIDVMYLCVTSVLPSPAVFDVEMTGTCLPYSFITLGMVQGRLWLWVGSQSCFCHMYQSEVFDKIIKAILSEILSQSKTTLSHFPHIYEHYSSLLWMVFSFFFASDLPHDLWPSQRSDADLQPDWYDAAVVSLGWLPTVPGSNAAGIPLRLLGVPQQDGGMCHGAVSVHAKLICHCGWICSFVEKRTIVVIIYWLMCLMVIRNI